MQNGIYSNHPCYQDDELPKCECPECGMEAGVETPQSDEVGLNFVCENCGFEWGERRSNTPSGAVDQ
jgi:predicted RNA-binding Zn-ribbon protein involved in translation (DUF1610 family)